MLGLSPTAASPAPGRDSGIHNGEEKSHEVRTRLLRVHKSACRLVPEALTPSGETGGVCLFPESAPRPQRG